MGKHPHTQTAWEDTFGWEESQVAWIQSWLPGCCRCRSVLNDESRTQGGRGTPPCSPRKGGSAGRDQAISLGCVEKGAMEIFQTPAQI